MRRRFQEPSPEELRRRDEERQKRVEEEKKYQAEFDVETKRILGSLEASPAIAQVRDYLKSNPPPERMVAARVAGWNQAFRKVKQNR